MRRAFKAALLALAGACTTTTHGEPLGQHEPPRLGDAPPEAADDKAEAKYQEILGRYSRHAELYSGVEGGEDTRMFGAATYQALSFREARVERGGAFRVEPRDVIEQKLAAERDEAARYDDFYFGVHMVDYRYDDFDKHNSIWRIALVGDVVEQTPILVQRQGRSTLDVRSLYPYMGDFWVAYRIRFDKLSQGRGEHLTLRLASSLGRIEMTFPSQ
jgi:hypothetical protein